jgi:RNA polymerase sigma factor (sigma-70 family)
MATAPLSQLLGHLRKLAARRCVHQSADQQLLDDFAATRDEAAFTALVSRHGPMVLRVCRRVLSHEQDAEDAFQATFLVLARHAASIRKRDTIAGWLHGVAYRTAMKAKRSAARRRNHENRLRSAPPPKSNGPSWDDVQSVLDEELQRLPERYRTAFVLSVLEGKAGAEIAAVLGCRKGTVKSRVSRAREMLQDPLARRGIHLATLLAALSVAEGAGRAALPASLAQTAVRSGLLVAAGKSVAESLPPHIAALAAGVTRAMFLTKIKIVVLLLLGTALVAGAGVLAQRTLAGAQNETPPGRNAAVPSTKQETDLPAAPNADALAIHGRVLDPDNRPIANAGIYAPETGKERKARQDGPVTRRAASDADGRFHLQLPRSIIKPGRSVPIIAAMDGFGLVWVELTEKNAAGALTLRLVKDLPIRGRLITTEGKPLAGVKVSVIGLMAFERLDDFLRAFQREPNHSDEGTGSRRLRWPLNNALRVTATDKDGRFEIRGAGAERVVGLSVDHPAVEPAAFLAVTRASFDARTFRLAMTRRDGPQVQLLGPVFEHVIASAAPTRRIEGTVREAGSGKAVVGAVVQAAGSEAVTDDRGHFELASRHRLPEYRLHVTAPRDRPLVARWVQVRATGTEPTRVDVEMPRGVVVTGRVYDKATGKGVPSSVSFVPLPENKVPKTDGLALNATADDAGRFRLVTVPGPGVLLAQVPGTLLKIDGVPIYPYKTAEFDAVDRPKVKMSDRLQGYHSFLAAGGGFVVLDIHSACKVLDVKDDGTAISCDLALDPGKTLTVHIQDPEGKPLPGAVVAGVSAQTLRTVRFQSGEGQIYVLDPAKPRPVVFLHVSRKLAANVLLRGDEKEPVAIRLAPAGVVTGRVLDADGQPVSGAEVYTLYKTSVGQQLMRSQRAMVLPVTDKDGRFRLDCVVPGLKFGLGFARGRQLFEPQTPLDVQAPESGRALDLGEIRARPRKR